MNIIIDFISDNYSWFLTITLILLFALIGYIFDTKREKNDLMKKSENEIDEESIENIIISEEKSLAEAVGNNKTPTSEIVENENNIELIEKEDNQE